MKKIFAIFLCVVMTVSAVSFAVTADPIDNTVIELDFSKISEIANITAGNGAKSSFQIGDSTGWMSSKSEFIQDDGVQVLKFVRDDGLLHGFDVNSLKDITSDPVVYSMTFKVTEMGEGSFFHVGMVTQNTNNQSWFYSFRLLADGTMMLDTNGGGIAAAGTNAGTLSFNEYHTLSVVYYLSSPSQIYYLDGVKIHETSGYRQGAITSAVSPVTRFKIETPKAAGNVQIYFKNVKVYNASRPDEVEAPLVKEVITLDFSQINTIKSITAENGAKSTFQIGDSTGWMSSKSEFIQDDGVQVLKFVRDDGLLHGFDLNTLKALTEDPVVYSMTFKVTEMGEGAFFHVAMVNQDTNSWFYSFRLLADGTMKLDTNGNGIAAAGTNAGTLSFNEYHTLSVVYYLSNPSQVYYLDGVKIHETSGYRQGAITAAISDCTRFKIETPKSDGNVEILFKSVSVYNASVPDEAADAIRVDSYQTRKIAGGETYDARFVASLNREMIENAEKITFTVSASYTDTLNPSPVAVAAKNLDIYTVYERIFAAGLPVDAPDGCYFALFVLTDIPNDVAVTFTITPKIIYKDASICTGKAVEVSFSAA